MRRVEAEKDKDKEKEEVGGEDVWAGGTEIQQICPLSFPLKNLLIEFMRASTSSKRDWRERWENNNTFKRIW